MLKKDIQISKLYFIELPKKRHRTQTPLVRPGIVLNLTERFRSNGDGTYSVGPEIDRYGRTLPLYPAATLDPDGEWQPCLVRTTSIHEWNDVAAERFEKQVEAFDKRRKNAEKVKEALAGIKADLVQLGLGEWLAETDNDDEDEDESGLCITFEYVSNRRSLSIDSGIVVHIPGEVINELVQRKNGEK